MKRALILAFLVFAPAVLLAALLPRLLNAPGSPRIGDPSVNNVPIAAPVDEDFEPTAPIEDGSADAEHGPRTERYLPPPTYDLSGGQLGRQRVPGTKGIGDVYRMYYDDPSANLYMSTVEHDGLRSIWRLDQQGGVERVFAANYQPGEIRIFGMSDGVIYVQHDNPSRMYRTDDQFATWQTVLSDFGMFWGMAGDGQGTIYATLHDYNRAILYRSVDNGLTWEEWKDFQKIFPEDAVTYAEGDARFRLRHLHDIIYSPTTDALIVGTGDVARYAIESRDGGETWKKVWHEGFTAHVPVKGVGRYLLGPDKLRGPGIALYDSKEGTVEEVWSPGAYNYAGYVYSMVNVDGIYYAAVHTESNEVEEVIPKFGVIVSPDAETWYPFLEYGPLTNHARTDIWLASSPVAIYASVNGVVYAFKPLTRDWFEFNIQRPFSSSL